MSRIFWDTTLLIYLFEGTGGPTLRAAGPFSDRPRAHSRGADRVSRGRSSTSQEAVIQVLTPKRGSTQRISTTHAPTATIAHSHSIRHPSPRAARGPSILSRRAG